MLGAGERTRTPDLRITNALLYRLSYTSILNCLATEVAIWDFELNVHQTRAIEL